MHLSLPTNATPSLARCSADWAGPDCSLSVCSLSCGGHGSCVAGACHCHRGWGGPLCDLQLCHPRCEEHGQCVNGSCICQQGWNGRHCSLEGCGQAGQGCGGHGDCRQDQGGLWGCSCQDGWGGESCERRQETDCQDEIDNDKGRKLLLASYLPPTYRIFLSSPPSLSLSAFNNQAEKYPKFTV